ncbi:hypothetical protein LZ017_19050 [Pelomonas sp. CA6]|uniref:hypothetical protein n=1 Tax=Pelomonas sp. CA6 TaxID=2907999 RepID=UPI001F4BF4DC|nr:hypothetical protein [Pelomonas sp. CA6]MCH7345480.1 hypothetical protein [Pelomonas sp. CA6]
MSALKRVFSCLASCVLLLGCSEASNGTGSISKRIGEIVHTPGATEMDLRKLPTFGWAYFLASRPGASREEVCKLIGAGRNVCGRIVRIEKAPDDHVYLLFGLNGQLTHIELHALANGHFDMEFPAEGLPKADAVFRIRRSSTGSGPDTIFLEPK